MARIIQVFWVFFNVIKNSSCTIRCKALGKKTTLGKKVTLEIGSQVLAKKIGDYTYINSNCIIDSTVESIGKYCSIAPGVKIGLGSHPMDWVTTHAMAYKKKYGFVAENKKEAVNEPTIIGNDVWIGANVTVLAGVKIGDGAIIGAHSLVTKDVAPYSIVVGAPAKHHKYRHTEERIEKLLKIKWWDLSPEILKSKIHLMKDVDKFIDSFD